MAVTKRPARSIDKMGGGDMAALVRELDSEIRSAWFSMQFYRNRAREERPSANLRYLEDLAYHCKRQLISLLRIREAGLNRVNKLWS